MKVILTQDIAKLGRRNDVVEVANGRGLNQLIPQGKALPATSENMKKVVAMQQSNAAAGAATDAAFTEAIEKLGDTTVTVSVAANEQGHLFEALKPEVIVEALQREGVAVGEQQVHIGTPIKATGTHQVMLVNGGTEAAVSLEVVSA